MVIRGPQIDPAELSPGEFAFAIRSDVEERGAKIVYLDSLNGYLHAMGEERFLNLQLHELLTYLNQQGIVTMMVVSPHGLLGQMQTPIDVTYLADTVIALRFFEAGGAVHKAHFRHQKTNRQSRDDHSRIEDRRGPASPSARSCPDFRGVLTGVPTLVETKPRPKARRKHGKR